MRWIWAKLCIDAIAAATAATTHHQFAEYRLFHALASWSRTRASSTASTMIAVAMSTQRSHQYLPRVGCSRLVGPAWVSLAGAS